jgi:hypothetical protein
MITPPTRPIIVSGMARSGTTVVGAMVRKCGDVLLFPELSPHSTPALFDLLAEVRATLESQRWRPFTERDIDTRIVELLRRIWAAGRDEEDDDVGQLRFGLKQPQAEDLHGAFTSLLGEFRPQWVYTVRDPLDVYDSTLRMAKWGDILPGEFVERCAASYEAALTLGAVGDLITFDVQRAASDAGYRERRAFEVKDFLGFGKPRGLRPFLKGWPAINVSGGRNAGSLAHADIDSRLVDLRSHPGYAALSDQYRSLCEH